MNKKLKVGIVGIGRICSNHAEEIASFPELFELVACADHVPERLTEEVPPQLEKCAKYDSLDAMLKHPDLDMVVIATRNPDHVPMALQIVAAGKIAVVEKPVATSVAEMQLLLDAAKAHPHKVFLRHNRRFEAGFIKAQQLIKSGIIGDVQYIRISRSVGFVRRNDWMTMTEFYGGLLTNWGPHLIDQALRFLDCEVVDIWADVRRVLSIGDGDDCFKILLKGANGIVAEVEMMPNTMHGRDLEIIGNRGTIVLCGNKLTAKYLDPVTELKELKPHPENPPKAYGNFDEKLYFISSEFDLPDVKMSILWKHLYDDAVNGIPTPVKLEQAMETVRITEQVFEKTGFGTPEKFLAAKNAKK